MLTPEASGALKKRTGREGIRTRTTDREGEPSPNAVFRLILVALVCLALASGAHSQTCSTEWENPVSGDWDDGSKWTDGIPASGDDACITAPGIYTVTIRQDYAPNITAQTLTVGGASGTQTLLGAGRFILGDLTVGANGRMEILPRTLAGTFGGLAATGTVLVEGVLTVTFNSGNFLTHTGTLEVASGGTLRGTNDARLGGQNFPFIIRGTAELSDGGSIYARTEVLGGTVRATSGEGFLFNGGGLLQDATLDAASGAALTVNGNYALGGTISGAPAGEVGFATGTLTAAAAGATLNVTGQGVRLGTGVQRQTVLTGGPVLNTGRLVIELNNTFTTIQATTLTNEGDLDLEGDLRLSDGSVVRNRPSGVIRMFATQFYQTPVNGVVQLVNEGLIVREDVGPGVTSARFNAVTLVSRPGSEIRTFGDYLDLASGPNTETLPPGVLLSGDGVVLFGVTPVRSTFSPGTESNPIGSLGPRTFDTLVLAPEALTILDVGANGVSDKIVDITTFAGASITLGGTLRIRVQPGYTPAPGDSWTIGVNGAAGTRVQGEFASIEVEGTYPNARFAVDTSVPNTITLRVLEPLAVAATDAEASERGLEPGRFEVYRTDYVTPEDPQTVSVRFRGDARLFADFTSDVVRGRVVVPGGATSVGVGLYPLTDDEVEAPEWAVLEAENNGVWTADSVRLLDSPPDGGFIVYATSPMSGSNLGGAVLTVSGQYIEPSTTLRLTGVGGPIDANRVTVNPEGTILRAWLSLDEVATGVRTIEMQGSGVTRTVPDAFEVQDIRYPEVTVQVLAPPAVGSGREGTYTVLLHNRGNTGVVGYASIAGFPTGSEWETDYVAVAQNGSETLPWHEFAAASETEVGLSIALPEVVLAPGESESFEVRVIVRGNSNVPLVGAWHYR